MRNRSPQEWCGPECKEVFKQRRLTYARAHKNDLPPEGLYFIDESIVRCIHRKKKQLCKKGQRPEPYEHMPYTAQCHVLGDIGYDGFRRLVNLTEILEKKKDWELKQKELRRQRRINGEPEPKKNKTFKFGFQAEDYQKVRTRTSFVPSESIIVKSMLADALRIELSPRSFKIAPHATGPRKLPRGHRSAVSC